MSNLVTNDSDASLREKILLLLAANDIEISVIEGKVNDFSNGVMNQDNSKLESIVSMVLTWNAGAVIIFLRGIHNSLSTWEPKKYAYVFDMLSPLLKRAREAAGF